MREFYTVYEKWNLEESTRLYAFYKIQEGSFSKLFCEKHKQYEYFMLLFEKAKELFSKIAGLEEVNTEDVIAYNKAVEVFKNEKYKWTEYKEVYQIAKDFYSLYEKLHFANFKLKNHELVSKIHAEIIEQAKILNV